MSDLIPLFDLDFDRVGDELIGTLGATGASAFAPLRDYVSDRARWVWGRARATDALKEIVERPADRAGRRPRAAGSFGQRAGLSVVECLCEEACGGPR